MKNLYIITGTSRGIGEAIAKSLADGNNKVIGISRSANPELEALFHKNVSEFTHWTIDLSETDKVEKIFEDKLHSLNGQQYQQVVLINNAGLLEPIDKVIRTRGEEVIKHINVNLTSLMLLSASFLRHFEDHDRKEIVSISSGAAYHPYPGWGSYCASKAGSLMFSKVLAEEQKSAKHPAKVISLAPGVVETDMQKTIRSKDDTQFPNLDKFIELKEKGLLSTTEKVGITIANTIVNNAKIENGAEIDLRTYE